MHGRNFFENFFWKNWLPSFSEEAKVFIPPFDIKETEDDLLITAELPGVDLSAIEVNLPGDQLVVKGEKKKEKEEKTENKHTIERSYGSFTRSIALPGEIVQDKAEATLKNGVLELRLPKTQLEKKAIRKIEVRKS